jgi:hypothetical protein
MPKVSHAVTVRATAQGLRRTLGNVVLGDQFIVWILLALGAAMCVGNLLALVRPRQTEGDEADLAVAPRGRSIAFVLLGGAVAVVALAALIN